MEVKGEVKVSPTRKVIRWLSENRYSISIACFLILAVIVLTSSREDWAFWAMLALATVSNLTLVLSCKLSKPVTIFLVMGIAAVVGVLIVMGLHR